MGEGGGSVPSVKMPSGALEPLIDPANAVRSLRAVAAQPKAACDMEQLAHVHRATHRLHR
jgi:hypothetical protein